MNNEKVTILYSEQVKVFEKQKECLEQFKKAIDSANKIKTLNSQEENVSKIINNFNIIQDNNKTLIKETNDAIEHIKKTSSKIFFSAFIAINLSFIFASTFAGLFVGLYLFDKELKNEVLADKLLTYEINKIKETENKYHNQIKTISEYKSAGFEFEKNVLVVPYDSVINDTTLGKRVIFFGELKSFY